MGLGLLARERGVYWRVTDPGGARTPQLADDFTLTLREAATESDVE